MNPTSLRARRIVLATCLPLAGFVAAQAVSAQSAPDKAESEGLIFERQQIMIQLDKDSTALGEMAAGLRKPDKLAETTRSIAQGAKDSLAAFEPNVPGGRAKPEVWSNWPDYKQRLEAFAAKADQMAKIAESGNLTGVVEIMADALPCKQCHDSYRAPKKPGAK
jgi:cytochrome c556